MQRFLLILLTGLIVGVAPVHALGRGLAPPVIHEPFTPLPCPLHPDTTLDIEGCQEMRILRTDRTIDRQVGAIFRLLQTESGRLSFVTGERDWLRFRRESCSAEASRYAGGTAAAVAYVSCTVRKNRSHLADLAAMRNALGRH